ncbi:MAG: TIGR00730 family Rossman fold protein [Actinobacteria bacterium]|nr:TIGR00730 family Rossman fold protein [Actinomycetota bacterium]
MAGYDLGDPDIDARIRDLVADAVAGAPGDGDGHELVAEMIVTALKLGRDRADRGDLKLANAALKEMRYSFLKFAPHRAMRKVTIFGSARTPAGDPNYHKAVEFARAIVEGRGWVVMTGAGPGIMEAGNEGAGVHNSFGVNIRLPFEATANPFVHESRLVNYKYFFTRKLTFMKESHAFVLFPGGFGTLDEAFELLTLVQTGKSDLHPIVLMEAEGTGYWEGWLEFVRSKVLGHGMIAPADLDLFTLTSDVGQAVDEICDFYRNYHSQRFVGDRLILRLMHEPTVADVAMLNERYGDLLASGEIEAVPATRVEVEDGDHPDLPRLRLHFDRRSLGRLRAMIDDLNALAPPGGPTPA